MNMNALRKYLGVAVASAVVSLGSVAAAKEIVFSCETSYQTSDSVIGPQVVFFIDEVKGTVRVLDHRVQHYEGGPMVGKLTKRSEKSYRIDWKLKNIKTQTSTVDIDYRAMLNRSTNKYMMKAVLRGYDNNSRGEGLCKVLR